jgi:biopolymer transport protein ExbB
MTSAQPMGFSHFISQTDALGLALFVILLAMSIASWTVIVTKIRQGLSSRGQANEFMTSFQKVSNLEDLSKLVDQNQTPHGRIAQAALSAARYAKTKAGSGLIDAESPSELVNRSLQQAIDEEAAQQEYGQTLLASVASSSPFVGLFGTVWGIYHALVSIGMSGQSSLDQVAGPVGEALIMTALGLAVAIPAALAYNAFQRQARLYAAQLERFAHDLFVLVATGSKPR